MPKCKCVHCGETFDRDKIPAIQVASSPPKYAHLKCAQLEEEEKKDKQALEEYLKKLFKLPYVESRVQKQIEDFRKQYDFTYSGIKKSLEYWYDVRGSDLEKAHGGIGIVPYIYQQSRDYYQALWEATQRNQGKTIQDYVSKTKEIIISLPQREVKKRNLFSFLDEEEDNGQQ